jgi:AraC-like DNA-binding protein
LTSIEQLANECSLDVSYVCRLFRRFDNESPYACLSRLRMTEAAVMLRNESLTINSISATLGFSDQYAFSKAFKRVFGMSPRQYREQEYETAAGPAR